MISLNSRLTYAVCMAAASYLALSLNLPHGQALAQSGNLPPVTVDAPKPRTAPASSRPTRRAASSGVARRTQRTAGAGAATSAPAPASALQNIRPGQDPRGPINGYVAERTLTGTKTNTPIMETPQAISVVGQEEIRDQNPQNLAAALRYAPGVRAETFAPIRAMTGSRSAGSTRRMWACFRMGFNSRASLLRPGNFRRGYPAHRYSARAVSRSLRWQRARRNCECHQQEASVHAEQYCRDWRRFFRNGYFSFDFGGPVITANGPSNELFYRLLGSVKGGPTQIDFTPDNSYFFAPSLTIKPDLDTTFTILASAWKNDTRVQGFLPYVERL